MSAIDLYADTAEGFDGRVAHAAAVLQSAALEHAGRIVQSTSLGAEDMVVTDLIARHGLRIPVATLDTGKLHAETLALIPRIEQRYGIPVAVYRPDHVEVVQFVSRHGERAMYDSIALRKACCGLRKLEPLGRMLAGAGAWITGLRREQSGTRGGVPFSEADDQGRMKFNPLPTGAGATSGTTSRPTTCRTTRCTTASCRASAVRRARAPSHSARTSAPAAGGGKTKPPRNAACM